MFFEQYLNNNYTEKQQYNGEPYIEIADCVFQHICTTPILSANEKLYYLLLDFEAIGNLKRANNRVTASNAKIWATSLGCSKSEIFRLQKSLERKQYLLIKRSSNIYNQNNRNLLMTSLPKSVFEQLISSTNIDRTVIENSNYENVSNDYYRNYLDSTKILLKFDFALFKKIIAVRNINSITKLFCIDYYSPCYLPNIRTNNQDQYYQTSFTYSSLMERYNITRSYLSSILIKLDKMHWIQKYRVGKFINPPVWGTRWYLDNIRNAEGYKKAI